MITDSNGAKGFAELLREQGGAHLQQQLQPKLPLPSANWQGTLIGLPVEQGSPLGYPSSSQAQQEQQGVPIRQFPTGATRDTDTGKLDYEGFLSPAVLRRYAEFMHKNRRMKDGSLRGSDNWQAGIPRDAYMKSGWRHMMDWWGHHRGVGGNEPLEDALCAVIFNAMGYLFEVLKANEAQNNQQAKDIDAAIARKVNEMAGQTNVGLR